MNPYLKKWKDRPAKALLARLLEVNMTLMGDEDDPSSPPALLPPGLIEEQNECHWIIEELEHRLMQTEFRCGPALEELKT